MRKFSTHLSKLRNTNRKTIFGVGAFFGALFFVTFALFIFNRPNYSVESSPVSFEEIQSLLKQKGIEINSFSELDNQKFAVYTQALYEKKLENLSNEDLLKEFESQLEKAKSQYPSNFSQAIITPENGGILKNGVVEVQFPVDSYTEPLLVSVITPSLNKVDEIKFNENDRINLQAYTLRGERVTKFDKNITITTKNIEASSNNLATYYLNRETNSWDKLSSSIDENNNVVATVNHFSEFTTTSEPTALAEDEYLYADCGTIVDDSFLNYDPNKADSDKSNCINFLGIWMPQQVGYLNTSLISNTWISTFSWHADYKSLEGETEVSIVVPEIPMLKSNNEDSPKYKAEAHYLLNYGEGVELYYVQIDLSKEAPGVISLGTHNFNGSAGSLSVLHLNLGEIYDGSSNEYLVADAVCFGECPANLDLVGPRITNVSPSALGGEFEIRADITDPESGVKSAYVSLNGNITPMVNIGGDTYAAESPSFEGENLDYYIVAYDNALNESIWSPLRGYVTRGTGLRIGVPPEAEQFVNFKKSFYNQVLPAKAGLDPCNQCTGDPVNTQNGNLLEQIEIITVQGRYPIDFAIQYNSLGGALGIFGESWTHSYNYKALKINKSIYVTYPGGNTQKFKLAEDGNYYPKNPYLTDKISEKGGNFVLTQADQTKIYFDSFGDIERVEDIAGNGANFYYSYQDKNINFSKLTEIKSDSGRFITFEYNDVDLVSKINLPDNKFVEFKYDENDDLISYIDENATTTNFEYADHVIIKKFSPEGHTYYANEFDEKRRITKQIAGEGFIQEYQYLEGKTLVTDSKGDVIEYSFNEDGLMNGNQDEISSQTRFEYDDNKRIIAEIDPEGNRTEYKYDDQGNQIYVKNSDGTEIVREFNELNLPTLIKDRRENNVSKFEYDSKGNLIKSTDALGNITEYKYDHLSQLSEIIDANGNSTFYNYNSNGDLIKLTDALGNVTWFEYDNLGQKTAEVDANGNKTTFEYDANGNLVKISKPLGYVEKFTYDKNNRLTSTTDANGNTSFYEYDSSENLVKITDAKGNSKQFSYGEMNNILTQQDENGVITKYEYAPDYQIKRIINAFGTADESATKYEYNKYDALEKTIDPLGRVSEYKYNSNRQLKEQIQDSTNISASTKYEYNQTGAVIKQIDAEGNATIFELDALDRTIKTIDAEGNITTTEYDKVGNVVSTTDAKGNTTTYKYDKANRLIQVTDAAGNPSRMAYDKVGNIISQTDAGGLVTRFEYDQLNRKVKEIVNPSPNISLGVNSNEQNLITTYEYDLNGNVTKSTNPRGFATTFEYDQLNRITKITDAKGNNSTREYDKVGNVISTTDRNGNTSKTKFDSLYRVAEQVNAKNHATKYTYDKVGNLVKAIDPRGAVTTLLYNGLNQNTQVIDALGGKTQMQYNKLGNVLKRIDANGNFTSYTYDNLYRTTSEINAEGHVSKVEYDANGNVVKQTDANGNSTNFEFDELNRVVKEINALNAKKSYNYDSVGNVTSLVDFNGNKDEFIYDAIYRRVEVIDAEGNKTKSIFDANSNLIQAIDANGFRTDYSFDEIDRLVEVINAEDEVTKYEYDNEANVTAEIAADSVVTSYKYDPIYLLSEVTLNYIPLEGESEGVSNSYVNLANDTNVNTVYGYDENANLVKITDPKNNSTNFAYDLLNRQVAETNALGNKWQFGYDAVGNRTSRVDANGKSTSYSYYPDNQLAQISYAGKHTVYYSYDKNNNRTQMVDNIGTTNWSYDALNRPTNVNDALSRNLNYKYDNESNVTEIKYPTGQVLKYGYLKNDWLNTVQDPDNITTKYDYDKVGNVVKSSNNNLTLTEKAYDKVYRVTSIQNKLINGSVTSSFDYTYDNVGQRTAVNKTYGKQKPSYQNQTFEYDAIRRLTSSNSTTEKGTITNSYAFDRNSNRIAWNSNDDSSTPRPFDKAELKYEYNAVNQLLKVTQKGSTPDGGNSKSKIQNSNEQEYIQQPPFDSAQGDTQTQISTKTIPQSSQEFIDSVKNFVNELEVQKGKQISDSAYEQINVKLNELLIKAEEGYLVQSEATDLLTEIKDLINNLYDAKEIKAPGIVTSLLTKLEKAELSVETLPVELNEEIIETDVIVNPGGQTLPPQANGQQKDKVKPENPSKDKFIQYTYDNNGNRISKLVNGYNGPEDKLTRYEYDPENRLAKVLNLQRSNPSQNWVERDVTQMAYDAAGRRLVKAYSPKSSFDSAQDDTKKSMSTIQADAQDDTNLSKAKVTEYTFNNLDPIAEFDVQNGKHTNLYRDLNQNIIASQSFTSDSSKKTFNEFDALDSVVGITSESGNSFNIRYEDYGKIDDNNTEQSDSTGGTYTDPHNHYTFSGQEWDENMEVYEYYSRAYDPEVGVWLRQDDYRGEYNMPNTLHRYNYVLQSPVNYKDLYGYAVPLLIGGGYAVGAAILSTAVKITAAAAVTLGVTYLVTETNIVSDTVGLVGDVVDVGFEIGKELLETGFEVGKEFATGAYNSADWHLKKGKDILDDVVEGCAGMLGLIQSKTFGAGIEFNSFARSLGKATGAGAALTAGGVAASNIDPNDMNKFIERLKKSLNQIAESIKRKQSPESIIRLDKGNSSFGEKPHIHFKDGSALNIDGTWKHGGRPLSNKEIQWLTDLNWTLPIK